MTATRWALGVLGAVAVVGLAAPLLAPPDALSVIDDAGPPLAPPSLAFPLGTDENGLSVLALTIAGARFSLGVGVVATASAVAVGTAVGVVAGSLRGWLDALLMRVTEWFLVLPQVPLAVVLAGVLGRGATALTLAVAVTSWPGVARVVRAGVLTAQARPHVERVRALGAGRGHLVRGHILPEVLPLVAVTAALVLANALLAEAALSFLGAGGTGSTSWGSMLRSATASGAVSAGAWWYLLAPGLAIVTVVLAAGTCARTLDPVQRQRGS